MYDKPTQSFIDGGEYRGHVGSASEKEGVKRARNGRSLFLKGTWRMRTETFGSHAAHVRRLRSDLPYSPGLTKHLPKH